MAKVAKLAETVDLGEVMEAVGSMPPDKLKAMIVALKNSAAADAPRPSRPCPTATSTASTTPSPTSSAPSPRACERSWRRRSSPVINDYWQRDETPREMLVKGFQDLDVIGAIFDEDGARTPGAQPDARAS